MVPNKLRIRGTNKSTIHTVTEEPCPGDHYLMWELMLPIACTFSNSSAKSNRCIIKPLMGNIQRPNCLKANKRPDYFHVAHKFLFNSPPPPPPFLFLDQPTCKRHQTFKPHWGHPQRRSLIESTSTHFG